MECCGTGGLQECCDKRWDRKDLLLNRNSKVPAERWFARIRPKQDQDGVYEKTQA